MEEGCGMWRRENEGYGGVGAPEDMERPFDLAGSLENEA